MGVSNTKGQTGSPSKAGKKKKATGVKMSVERKRELLARALKRDLAKAERQVAVIRRRLGAHMMREAKAFAQR